MSDNSDTTNERVAREALMRDSPFYPLAPERMLLETRRCVAFFDKYPVSKEIRRKIDRFLTTAKKWCNTSPSATSVCIAGWSEPVALLNRADTAEVGPLLSGGP
jgi:hypothetical protein